MATNNPTWGEERIADELLLKIGIQISPRSVRRYMPKDPQRPKAPTQRWMTFVRNHAKAISCCGLLHCGDGDISRPLCAGDHGDWNTAHRSRERDATSNGLVDAATVPRMCHRRRGLQVHHSRPGQHLFASTGFLTPNVGSESVENAVPVSASECIL